VHNIVLSMPSPTRPEKVLAAAKVFAREKFGVAHRYAMVLRTHQQHPHVHVVVRAEDDEGRHLHIDKAMLREWRQDFARLMREQGVPANATPRAWRGRGRAKKSDYLHRANRRGHSRVLASEATEMIKELHATRTIQDPAQPKLIESRRALVAGWMRVAEALDAQGEIELAGDVRYFVKYLPPRRTDKEELAVRYVDHLRSKDEKRTPPSPQRELELTR
jgi:MobA/VirD2-like, nuclease domain